MGGTYLIIRILAAKTVSRLGWSGNYAFNLKLNKVRNIKCFRQVNRSILYFKKLVESTEFEYLLKHEEEIKQNWVKFLCKTSIK